MNFFIILGLFMLGAYVLQVLLTLKQIKHFTKVYQSMRQKGKVAIGRRSGKVKAGTIVMFAVDDQGAILDCQKMQGVTILARFKAMPQFIGEDIHYLDKYHPKFRQCNRLLQEAILNAREIYVRVQAGNYQEQPAVSPLTGAALQLNLWKTKLQMKLKKEC